MTFPNAPTPKSNTPIGSGILTFPGDLLSINSTPTTTTGTTTAVASGGTTYSNSSGGYFSQFQFANAATITGVGTPFNTSGNPGFPTLSGTNNIYLPLPVKINNISLHLWQDAAATDFVPILQSQGVSTALGYFQQAINPWMYMTYKQPLMREFTFQYILAPSSPAESQTLSQILAAFQTAALPNYNNNGITLDYPFLVLCRLNPSAFLFDLKPLCIISVEIDYSGSGHGTSFFNDGSPTIVAFTIHMKETQILTRNDIAARGGKLTSSMTSTG